MANILDILKIEKTLRKSLKDYAVTAKYDEEVLVRFITVDLYINLTAEDAPPKAKSPNVSKDIGAHTVPM